MGFEARGGAVTAGEAAPLPVLDATSVLANLLDDPLVVVDVGCRWGFSDVWTRLGSRCLTIGFDPDAEECRRLARRYRGQAQVRLEPVGLDEEPGLATLYLTVNPGGYSLLPPAMDAVERHPGLTGGRLEGTAVVEVTTLDAWCEEQGVDRVDVIKLDTQGTELAILRGAAETLGRVRAVEVEVEFNQLYEGVPLFGDVDHYLRGKGFVLWRLRNLAHYGRFGARRGWRVADAHYFDDDVVCFPTASGQLYWANAYYVHRDVADPPQDAGWAELVKDACITSAFGFHDLSGLALDRARAAAPPEIAATIDLAGSEEMMAARREQELSDAALPLKGSLTVDAADPLFEGVGWGPPLHFPFGSVRWSGPGRDAFLDFPVVLAPGTRVEVLAVSAINAGVSETLTVDVNGVAVQLVRSPHDLGVLHAGVVPAGYRTERRFTRLAVRTVETRPFNSAHPGSADDREVGVAVAWVRLTSPEPP